MNFQNVISSQNLHYSFSGRQSKAMDQYYHIIYHNLGCKAAYIKPETFLIYKRHKLLLVCKAFCNDA